MKTTVGIALLVLAMVSSCWADADKARSIATTIFWSESGPHHFQFQYEMLKVQIPEVGRLDLQLYADRARHGVDWAWAGTPAIRLIQSKELMLSLSPGVILTTRQQLFVGSDAAVSLPKLKVSVQQRCYRHGIADVNLTFARWMPMSTVGILYHLNASRLRAPEAYLGPSIRFGPLQVEGGPSLTRRGAWLLSGSAHFKF